MHGYDHMVEREEYQRSSLSDIDTTCSSTIFTFRGPKEAHCRSDGTDTKFEKQILDIENLEN
jgi:hypothetical protein